MWLLIGADRIVGHHNHVVVVVFNRVVHWFNHFGHDMGFSAVPLYLYPITDLERPFHMDCQSMNMSKMTFLNASPIIIEVTLRSLGFHNGAFQLATKMPAPAVRIRLAQLRPWVDVVPCAQTACLQTV